MKIRLLRKCPLIKYPYLVLYVGYLNRRNILSCRKVFNEIWSCISDVLAIQLKFWLANLSSSQSIKVLTNKLKQPEVHIIEDFIISVEFVVMKVKTLQFQPNLSYSESVQSRMKGYWLKFDWKTLNRLDTTCCNDIYNFP